MAPKLLSPTVHAALDYGLGAALMTLPRALGLNRRSTVFFGAFGAVAVVVNALTRTPLGVRPLIPFRTHRTVDLAADPVFLTLPLVIDIAREPRARALWLASSALLVGNVLLTDWSEQTRER